MNRRNFLRTCTIASSFALSAPLLSGCTPSLGQQSGSRGTGAAQQKFALIIPQSGEFANIGEDMAKAIELAISNSASSTNMSIFDAGGTDSTAEEAAKKAVDSGAAMIFGPLRSSQTLAVLKVAGRVPIVTFSNDESLSGEGAFVFGLTAEQSVLTMFTYAKAQGMKRLAVLGSPTPFGEGSVKAAARVASAGGLELTAALLRDPNSPGILDALRTEAGGSLPEAVYVPDAGARLYSFARALRGTGVQLLGSAQWATADLVGQSDLVGAAYAAPSPTVFNPFAAEYQSRFEKSPGIVAALAFDAVLIGQGMLAANELSVKGLQREAGFSGVLGPFSFDRTRKCLRDLAVLSVGRTGIETVAEVAGV